LAVHCSNGFDTRFQPLSKYSFQSIQSWPLSLGADMRRREFISLLGGAAVAWPLAARAQQGERMRRVGVLVNDVETDPQVQGRIAAFRQALEQLGWLEGRNIHIELRFSANNYERVPQLAQEMVALNPDVIFANTTPAVKTLQANTRTIPIVFVSVSDPVGAGVVASLARPGGNTTGLLLYEESITGKWLGMLKEISPRLMRAALVANPKGFTYDHFLRSSKAIAPALGIELAPTPIENDAADIERHIEVIARAPNSGIFVPPDNATVQHRDLIIALAARFRLPAVYAFRYFVTAGGLMSYGIDILEQNRQAASYVDRILRGANPADLPVQAPTRYETVLNLKTAKVLGFDVPPTLLVRADEVIE
jgi:putative ABC transport system substrate-binding protein